MNAEELRAMQAPFKSRYKEDATAAQVTLKATGQLGEERLTCKVDTGRALVEAGLHPATGGDGLSACSGDMLLEALVGCAGVTFAPSPRPWRFPSAAARSRPRAISISAARSA